jgi:membrane protein DedA with SNARE-associated domain
MFHWLHSLFPHYGNMALFVATYLNSLGLPFPGEPILFGAGFIEGKDGLSMWGSIAAGTAAGFLGGESAFWLGRWLGYSRVKKIHWLHLTAKRFEWMEHFFKRYGAKTVFIARFIAMLPALIPNVLAGMAEMRWGVFLFYNLTGSAVYSALYILLGYLLGQHWNFLEAWLGPTAIYLIIQGIVLIILGVIFRRFICDLWVRIFCAKRKRK